MKDSRNLHPQPQTVNLRQETFTSLLTGETITGSVELSGYGVQVLERIN